MKNRLELFQGTIKQSHSTQFTFLSFQIAARVTISLLFAIGKQFYIINAKMRAICFMFLFFCGVVCPPPYSYPYLSPSPKNIKSNQSQSSPISPFQQDHGAPETKTKQGTPILEKEDTFKNEPKGVMPQSLFEDHKESSSEGILFIESVILIGFFTAIIFACVWWKKKRLADPIEQKPIELKEILLTSMELQAAQKRLTAEDVTQRSSQPNKLF